MRGPSQNSEHLVVEQKGFRILMLGLLVAGFLGLMVRAMFSPARMQYEVEKIIGNTGSRAKITIKGAHLSLVSGIWPRVAVVVEGIHVESRESCFKGFLVDIESLEVPAALSSLWQRRFVVNELLIHQAQIRAPQYALSCQKSEEVVPEQSVDQGNPSEIGKLAGVSAPPIVQTVSFEKPQLKHVYIDQLLLSSKSQPELSINLEDLEVDVQSSTIQQFSVDGNLRLFHQVFGEAQGPSAKIKIDVEKDQVKSKVSGVWKVGSFDLGLVIDRQAKEGELNGDLRYVPMSHLMALLGSYKIINNVPDIKSSWLSLKLEAKLQNQAGQHHLKILDLKWDGDFGEIKADLVDLSVRENKIQWKPFEIKTDEISIDNLLASLGIYEPIPQVAKWGSLEAKIKVNENSVFKMEAKGSDLSTIFSSRGKRELQKVNSYTFKLTHSNENLTAQISDIKLEDGEIKGGVDLRKHQDDWNINVDLSSIDLSQRVRRLISHNGEMGRASLGFNGLVRDSKLTRLTGNLKLDSGKLDDMSVDHFSASFTLGNTGLVYLIGAQNVKFEETSPYYRLFNDVQADFEGMKEIQFKQISGRVQKTDTSLFAELGGRITGGNFTFTGGWENINQLAGDLVLKTPKTIKSYLLTGTREKPELSVKP